MDNKNYVVFESGDLLWVNVIVAESVSPNFYIYIKIAEPLQIYVSSCKGFASLYINQYYYILVYIKPSKKTQDLLKDILEAETHDLGRGEEVDLLCSGWTYILEMTSAFMSYDHIMVIITTQVIIELYHKKAHLSRKCGNSLIIFSPFPLTSNQISARFIPKK